MRRYDVFQNEISNRMSHLRALYDSFEIFNGKNFHWERILNGCKKNLGSNLYYYIPSTRSVAYISQNFDGTFFGDNNPKCAAVHYERLHNKSVASYLFKKFKVIINDEL